MKKATTKFFLDKFRKYQDQRLFCDDPVKRHRTVAAQFIDGNNWGQSVIAISFDGYSVTYIPEQFLFSDLNVPPEYLRLYKGEGVTVKIENGAIVGMDGTVYGDYNVDLIKREAPKDFETITYSPEKHAITYWQYDIPIWSVMILRRRKK